jgi:hypothetical protein
MPKKFSGQAPLLHKRIRVAIFGSPQYESVRCAYLWAVNEQVEKFVKIGLPTAPWLQLEQ